MWELEPDLVVLATPNATHVPLALEAVRRSVAVVVDKPLGLSVSDAQPLVDAAVTAGVPLGVFHNRRWDGDCTPRNRSLRSRFRGDPATS